MDRLNIRVLKRKKHKEIKELIEDGLTTMSDTYLYTGSPDSFFPWNQTFRKWFKDLSGVDITDLQEDEYIRFPLDIRSKETIVECIVGSDGVTELYYYVAHRILEKTIAMDQLMVSAVVEHEKSWTLNQKLQYAQNEVIGESGVWERLRETTNELKFQPEDDAEQMKLKLTVFEALVEQLKTLAPKTLDTELKLANALCSLIEDDSVLGRRAHEFRQWLAVNADFEPVAYAKVLNQVKDMFGEVD